MAKTSSTTKEGEIKMELKTGFAPYRRSKQTTFKIMLELLIVLLVVYLAAIIYNFTLGAAYGLKAILMLLVSIVTTFLCDLFVAGIRYKKDKDDAFGPYLSKFLLGNYSIITAVILTLTVPIGTPYYVLIVGNIFATLLVKHAFGGFGNNIVNPAVAARIVLLLTFGSTLKATLGTDPIAGGSAAGATITTSYATQVGAKWLLGSLPEANGLTMLDIYLGRYSAAIGETFTILLLVAGVYLAVRKIINWRTPVFYFGTIALVAIPLALIAKVNVGNYLLLTFGLGGVVFGGVFMLTDPVTSPTSNFGKALIGVIAAFLTMLIRVAGNLPEGVAISILFVNFLVPVIDKLNGGVTNKDLWKKYVVAATLGLVTIGTMSAIGAGKMAKLAPGEDDTSEEPPVEIFVSYAGTYTSPAPDGGEHSSEFTTNVEVGLDIEFNIVKLEISDYASPPKYLKDNELEQLVSFYTTLDVKGFRDLSAISISDAGASVGEGAHLIPGKGYSSVAIYKAIENAFSDINIATGSHTSAMCGEHCTYEDETLTVDVYTSLEESKILTLNLSEEGQSTDSFKNKWANKYPEILALYQGLDIDTFIGYTDPAELYVVDGDDLAAGLTFTCDRLFYAVQDAFMH